MSEKARTGTILDFLSYSDFDSGAVDEGGVVTRGRPAQFQEVVQYIGPWIDPIGGIPEHTRRNALALAGAGEKVHLVSTHMMEDVPLEVAARMKDLMDVDAGSYRLRIIQGVVNEPFVAKYVTHRHMSLEALAARNACTVFYVVMEYEGVSPDLARMLGYARQVWTGSERTRAMLERAGVPADKLHVVPMPFSTTDPLLERRQEARRPGPPRFLYIGKWEPRKAQHSMIGAFLMAFRPGEAELVVKTSPYAPKFAGYPKDIGESVTRWIADERVQANGWTAENLFPNLSMITANVPRERIESLYRWSDVYLSLSHGEGFDMPAFDAKLAGKLLVYTASGGPEDFAQPGDVAVPFEGHEPCHPWYQWPADAVWTKSSPENAVEPLRKAAALIRSGFQAQPLGEEYSAEVVGARMKELLEPIGRRA